MNNDNPFLQYSDALDNRQRIRAVLLDFFPDERVKSNVLVIAYDSGIALAIKNRVMLDNTFALRFIKILTSDYAIQNRMAKWAVLYWMKMYGVQVLGKKIDISDEIGDLAIEESEECTPNFVPPVSLPMQNQTGIGQKLEDLGENEKLSKSLINIEMHTFQAFGINRFTCAVRKNCTGNTETCLTITGEYEGKTSKYILLVFMCYNPQNELFGTSFHDTISDDFKGSATYSTIMSVPKWETIKKIEVKAILNPAMIW